MYLKVLLGKQIYDDIVNTLYDAQLPNSSYAIVKDWIASFKRGKCSIQYFQRPGKHLKTSMCDIIRHWEFHTNEFLTFYTSIWLYVETLRSVCTCVRFKNDSEFLSRVVTMDETWLHFYDLKTK